MPPVKKRSFIDLTGSDEAAYPPSGPSNKRPVLLSSQASRLNLNSRGTGLAGSDKTHMSSASSFSSSPSVPTATQSDIEPLHLTQEEDGPDTELYSTHGPF